MPTVSTVNHKLQIYTPRLLWSGVLVLGAHRRLSDFINDAQLSFIEISQVTMNGWDARTGELTTPYVPLPAIVPSQTPESPTVKNVPPAAPVSLATCAIAKHNIIALLAYTDPTQKRDSTLDRVPKIPRRVLVHAPPLLLEGYIHFLRDMTWQEGIYGLRQDFINLTDATIWCADTGVKIVSKAEFAMVGRTWIAGIHPTGPEAQPAATLG